MQFLFSNVKFIKNSQKYLPKHLFIKCSKGHLARGAISQTSILQSCKLFWWDLDPYSFNESCFQNKIRHNWWSQVHCEWFCGKYRSRSYQKSLQLCKIEVWEIAPRVRWPFWTFNVEIIFCYFFVIFNKSNVRKQKLH